MTQNRSREKSGEPGGADKGDRAIGAAISKIFEREMSRQRRAVERASLARTRLDFVVDAVARLNSDAHFLTLLRAEAMQTAPRFILDRADPETSREQVGKAIELPPPEESEEPIEADVESLLRDLKGGNLTSIREHFVIMRLVHCGMSKSAIAAAVDSGADYIRYKTRLLIGISKEVVSLFRDLHVTPHTFDVFRKMKKKRQVEVAKLMIAAGNHSYGYARGLLAATRQRDLVKAKRLGGISSRKMARMEREMAHIQSAVLRVESSYGDDMLNLAITSGYLAKLTSNGEITSYLEGKHPEILEAFHKIIAAGIGA